MEQTIYFALREAAEKSTDRAAILGIGRDSLSHRGLIQTIDRHIETLKTMGVRRGTRVAIVMPNGPEAAVCCLAVAACATVAPLNPALTAAQFQESLLAIQPKAL